ncbi:ABC transporter ATP-binding protein [Myxacorys almedinensis]|uniref:ATP-binding cassette domain-containing protein n=1 Tax=Myxacorys almedinensis A TaxID=2690445 RepID=A0A8J7Z3K9_9CYAN|nr:ABC transporter ATP-binding protein [Myxacorys almedinensis]NDJ19364.1 ATP-binding cassette domain-containing protein [Myxacorys almedinensis A]
MIEVEHLSKIYGSTPAIEDVTFSVAPGEILGFLGPNGAGKTTTMRILSGYLPASQGTAKVAGFEVHEHSMQVRQRIGYLPETPPLYPEMTVEGFLNFVAQIKGVSAGDRASRITLALQKCNLLEKRKTLIRKLSKGFRQRVGIAQAIVHDPPVIILDEPTVGLDPRQIIDVRNLIKQLANDHTVILSTHILPEVSMTCDRIAIINRGRVVATNTPESLMEQLVGGSGYELEIAGNSLAIQQCLKRVKGVKYVEEMRIENMPEHRIKVRVVAESNTEPGHAIAVALVQNGVKLYEMRRVQASLEDVFLELTTEEKPVDPTESETVETEIPASASANVNSEETAPSSTPSQIPESTEDAE